MLLARTKHRSIKHRTIKRKTIKRKTIKRKTIKRRTIKSRAIKRRTIKSRAIKRRAIKRRTIKSKFKGGALLSSLKLPIVPKAKDYPITAKAAKAAEQYLPRTARVLGSLGVRLSTESPPTEPAPAAAPTAQAAAVETLKFYD